MIHAADQSTSSSHDCLPDSGVVGASTGVQSSVIESHVGLGHIFRSVSFARSISSPQSQRLEKPGVKHGVLELSTKLLTNMLRYFVAPIVVRKIGLQVGS